MTVERYELAPGLSISRVLTGLWQVADMERDGSVVDGVSAAQSMAPYVEAGVTTFDMADHYGSAEQIVGEFQAAAVKSAVGTVQALTKWVPKPGPVSPEDARAAVDRARQRLQTECLDLLQFHAWNYADPSYLDALFALDELRQEGLIRHLGLTNTDAPHWRMLLDSGLDLVSNQVCCSLIDRRALASGAMTELCSLRDVRLLAYGALAGGFLTARWLGQSEPQELTTWSQMKYKRFIDAAGGWEALQSVLETAQRVADRLDVSIANVACRYVLEQPTVAGLIIGARLGESEHLEETLRLFSFELDDVSRREIEQAVAQLEPVPGRSGDEYRKPPFLTASGDLSHHLDRMPEPYPVKVDAHGRRRAFSGVSWETMAGYSRAVRSGDVIRVSGTTASHGDRLIGGDDPASQTEFVLDKIEGSIVSLGGRLEDVVRTRVFVSRTEHWEPVARVHGERFRDIQPANTLVQASLIGDEFLVEIEAEAEVDDRE